MQNFSANGQTRHTLRTTLFVVVGVVVLIALAVFTRDVLTIRKQILSGTYDFDQYGKLTSGSGGANVELARTFDVATSDDPVIGPPGAKVTIVEFGDFECPFCKQSFPIIRTLAQEFKDDVRLVYRDFPLDAIHPAARLAAYAGYCADEQGLFWPFHDKLFQNQEDLSRSALVQYANQVGLDTDSFSVCLDSEAARDEVKRDVAAGEASGVLGTPTWFINGIRVAGVIPEDVFRQIIIDIIRKK